MIFMYLSDKIFPYGAVDDEVVFTTFYIDEDDPRYLIDIEGIFPPPELCGIVDTFKREIVGYYAWNTYVDPKRNIRFFRGKESNPRRKYALCQFLRGSLPEAKRIKDLLFLMEVGIRPYETVEKENIKLLKVFFAKPD